MLSDAVTAVESTEQVVERVRQTLLVAIRDAPAERLGIVLEAVKRLLIEISGALEDRLDLEDAGASLEEMARTGEKPIPWEKVKADLGL